MRFDTPVWPESCKQPCRTVTHHIWSPLSTHFQNMWYSSSFCVRPSCPVLPQSRIVLRQHCFLEDSRGYRDYSFNESTKPSSIIPGEVNSCIIWPTLLLFFFFCLFAWVLKNHLLQYIEKQETNTINSAILPWYSASFCWIFHVPYLLLGFKVFLFAFFNHASLGSLILAPPAFVVFSL